MLKEILLNPVENCIKDKNDKKYIIILDTLRNNFDKYILSLSKKNYAPAYIIRKNGDIHKLYDEFYYSNLTDIEKINKSSIFIALENSGKLTKFKDSFLNWCNEEISIKNIHETISLKEFCYYDKYTVTQTKSLGHLIIYLSNKHNLNIKEISVKNKEDNAIIFLRDIDIFSNSPNPSFNIDNLNSIIFNN